MNFIVDENISFAQEAFGRLGNVRLMHGREINAASVKDAQVLIVRSITNVNRDLLEGSAVKFVGTATIGTDHLDKHYLNAKGIEFVSAKGCNAQAVAEYVITAILFAAVKRGIRLKGKSISVIGFGNIGTRVTKMCRVLGMKVLINDPPLKDNGQCTESVSLNEALEADIITLHTPMNISGPYKTHHLLNEANLHLIKPDAILINAFRGAVIDNSALLNKLIDYKNLTAILDVWEDEPDINVELLDRVTAASPHIAGYTLEGKVNGTVMIYEAVCRHLGIVPDWKPLLPEVDNSVIMAVGNANREKQLHTVLSSVYDIKLDTESTKKMRIMTDNERMEYFDLLRKQYRLRREFSNYSVRFPSSDDSLRQVLAGLGFHV